MQNFKKRPTGEDDPRSGGPGGGLTQPAPEPGAAVLLELSLAEAKAISDCYLRGGTKRYVPNHSVPLATITRLGAAGVFDVRLDLQSRATYQLTARGLQHLVLAERLIAAAPSAAAL